MKCSNFPKSIFVAALTLASCSSMPNGPDANQSEVEKFASPLIVGGRDIAILDVPWQASISIATAQGNVRCGGIIVTPIHILTAAHCIDQSEFSPNRPYQPYLPTSVKVFTGSEIYANGRVSEVTQIIKHDLWRAPDWAFGYDAAILVLSGPIPNAQPIPIRTPRVEPSIGPAAVSGWGYISGSNMQPHQLQATKINVLSDQVCRSDLSNPDWLHPTMLCAASQKSAACGGDSGGPLVVGSTAHPQLIGIVSWGSSEICGQPTKSGRLLGAYTRVSAVANWLSRATNGAVRMTEAFPDPLIDVSPRNGTTMKAKDIVK
jgi:secreted trypsin-like serine protease